LSGPRSSACAKSCHGYFDIELDIVWDAAERDVPALKRPVERFLKRLEELGYGR
jgi:uncharacterized protein with HEPN domain